MLDRLEPMVSTKQKPQKGLSCNRLNNSQIYQAGVLFVLHFVQHYPGIQQYAGHWAQKKTGIEINKLRSIL
mgnify:CR=1 FL=1